MANYRKGDWVKHLKKDSWGRGYVMEVIDEQKITIFFEHADSVKNFDVSIAKLEKIQLDSSEKNKWINDLRRYAKFPWPTTNAPIGIHGLGDVFSYKEGLLSYVGYRVGHEGEPRQVRQSILDWVFHNRLPRVQSEEYMTQWGEPQTSARLQKMANVLAGLTRNVKRNTNADYSVTIRDRESDLTYLYNEYYVEYYVKKIRFHWPPTQN